MIQYKFSNEGEIVLNIILIILAYILGSIPSGVWLGKLLYQKDLRDYGSGNTGATNTFRVLGIKAGSLVMFFDILKGTIATLLPIWLNADINPIFIGIFAIVGHIYSIFLKFDGGKAVATSAGVVLALHPIYLFFLVLVFLIILYITSTVSMASIGVVIVAAILSFFVGDNIFSVIISFIALTVIYLHRENIKRIKNGTENKVPFGLNKN